MKLKINIPAKRVKHILLRIPVMAGENMFAAYLILLIIAMLASLFIFYVYVYSPVPPDSRTQIPHTTFQEERFLGVLEELDSQAIRFQELDFKNYRNVFLPNQQF